MGGKNRSKKREAGFNEAFVRHQNPSIVSLIFKGHSLFGLGEHNVVAIGTNFGSQCSADGKIETCLPARAVQSWTIVLSAHENLAKLIDLGLPDGGCTLGQR